VFPDPDDTMLLAMGFVLFCLLVAIWLLYLMHRLRNLSRSLRKIEDAATLRRAKGQKSITRDGEVAKGLK
jgi:hypothetical protein